MRKIAFIAMLVSAAILMTSCGGSSDEQNANQDSTKIVNNSTDSVVKDSPAIAVCVYDGTPLREEPGKSGKWISGINMGETVFYADETKTDPAEKRDYYKVKLSDGKTGWAPDYGIILNATPAVALEEAVIYKRPDILTNTDKKMPLMHFVAISTENEDNWAEIIGEGKKLKGWVQADKLTKNKEDIAVAILASKVLAKETGKSLIDKLNEIIENTPYPNSVFIKILMERRDAEKDKLEYEGQDSGNKEDQMSGE
ncbi:MAG: SH3 domain-containing protein [Bacteroidetes bacterium]|nr:SH3 domain-containing protein [Bacteroidota bacterium]MBU1720199.1 SH3 domain-containing protein [Bacteroidota bacterium]